MFRKKAEETSDLTQPPPQPDGSVEFILRSRRLPEEHFEKISRMMYDLCRINLHDGKKELVQARLNKRLRQLGLENYDQYLDYVERDASGLELSVMVDSLTTNMTFFFREPDHFNFLKDEFLAKFDTNKEKKLRIWSAGCSSGEEAFTLAILLRETLPDIDRIDALVLGTDISGRVLATAKNGVYGEARLKDTPREIVSRYFAAFSDQDMTFHRVKPELTKLVRFRKLNLMESWPMKGPFDVIMCRNVMIYFDKKTQAELVGRFFNALRPGGFFIVGHSESLTAVAHNFKYVKPTIYMRP